LAENFGERVFPAVQAVADEIYYIDLRGTGFGRKQKYLARLAGTLLQTTAWSLQLWGNLLNISGTWGGNIFEYPMVYPLNFLLAAFPFSRLMWLSL
jgi:hypothetical protein